MPLFLDLFAGAGGLSEGFIQAGFVPVAHIEMDKAACNTLRTRAAYHWLKRNNNVSEYNRYLRGEISRDKFYSCVPPEVLASVLNYEISSESLPCIFQKVDSLLEGNPLDFIVGGPPCQAYSIAGRSRSDTNMVGDKRNYLYKLYAKFLEKYQPKFFVFENVVGLLSAKESDGTKHLDNMRSLFERAGYSTNYRVLNASDYGVLQNRKRVIIIGRKGNDPFDYPEIAKTENCYHVNDLLIDLPAVRAGEGCMGPVKTAHYDREYLYRFKIKEQDQEYVTLHQARPNTKQDLEIYRIAVEIWNKEKKRLLYKNLPVELQSHNNTASFLDRFKVVAGNLSCAQTVVAHISRDGHYYIHPDIVQNRSLTPREAARIQTFPDNYFFESVSGKPSRTLAYKQIGNAVPVRLAYCIANALLNKLDEEDTNVK